MTWFKTYILIMESLTGLLLIGLSIPLIQRRVPPNHWYGFRVPRTLRSASVWYDANAYAGKALIIPALLMILISTTLYAIPTLDPPTYATICAGVTVGSMLVCAVFCLRYLASIPDDPSA